MLDLLKLVVAALIGLAITAVQRRVFPDRIVTPSMEQAQVLLTVAGALMMMVIGNSLARAFGIAGAASIIRFRTPVEDPRDVTVLFLLMGLGMAAGLGALTLAAARHRISGVLPGSPRLPRRNERALPESRARRQRDTPSPRKVEALLASRHVRLEPLELTIERGGRDALSRARFPGRVPRRAEALLLGNGQTGIKSVSWEATRKA